MTTTVNTDLRFKRKPNSKYRSRSISHRTAASNSPPSTRERIGKKPKAVRSSGNLGPNRAALLRALETRNAPDETMTTAVAQHSLFAAPHSTADTSSNQVPEVPLTQTQTSQKPAPPPVTLTTEELIEHIFQSMCKGRRWERELLFGASDSQLGRAFGNCWCSGQTIELEFRSEGEPTLRAVDAVFKTEVFTLSAPRNCYSHSPHCRDPSGEE